MRTIPWLVVVAVVAWWGLNGLIWAAQVITMQSSLGEPVDVRQVLRLQMVSAALWVPCTLWLLWATARAPIERERWLAPTAWLLLAVLAVVVFRAVAVMVLDPWIGWYAAPPTWGDVLVTSVLNNTLMGCLIVGVGHALVYATRSRARERQTRILQERLTQARLDALSAQLNPHFLFNALNSIAEMVHHDADAADRMLVQLGGLLRHSLESSRDQHSTLEEEMAAIDYYIGIERVRLGERLRFRRSIDADTLRAQVPRLMLQPLVENAVAHAVAQRDTPSTVEVRAARDGGRLVFEVHDEGAGTQARPGFGMGLSNTRARLECLYAGAHSLDITPLRGGGTRVRVSLPLTLGQVP
ncbi:sensor histidine kinase [Novilysobacter spongiicola]|uniref:Histidine kinase-, DNA gyrase B-, and HSP90-like ATPase n=1 Tax=Lysobacter spongiicola DSM 21749 TaxID=1122188 RepID=A0A1T4RI98_9GAMM|nr:histidine kinase [Lysobacter spongiicola]SKA15724.1 Histidine kinase-, DNA gyrase B-, and HSP90-like ATPase [Lysobacter spongiicola DSM 21749]